MSASDEDRCKETKAVIEVAITETVTTGDEEV